MNTSLDAESHAIKAYPLEPFFELSPDLLCIAGFDGYFKKINPAVSRLLGYSERELFSRPINDFVFEEDKNITAKVRNDLTKNIPLYHFENRYVTKTGEIVWLSWTSLPLQNEQLVFAVAKNITSKKKLEEQRNILLADMAKINKELRQLAYTTSHDLRSPVNNLLSIFNLFDVSKINDAETLEFITILKYSSETLQQRLDNYLDVLTNKDSLQGQIEELDLRETLKTVLHSIKALIKDSNATINYDFCAINKIKFNRIYLESIFLNLITNSIKYARQDHLPVIEISTIRMNGRNKLVVSDNGSGFDMQHVKDKIFGLHQKFHHHADSKGIGLYLVHNHVMSLGGQIEIESKINEGTKFIITFKD
jgi:PAS domain S-box-containing protein